jgi:fructose-bisphosphate aldolase, class II
MMLDREHNKTLHMLDQAALGGYGVLAVIAYNIEHFTAFIRAAESFR